MLKIISNDWTFDIEPVGMIKVASSGLKGHDLKSFQKRAYEGAVKFVQENPPKSGEEYVHVVALGALEYYGPNRKGDAFQEDVCRKYNDTFRKYARWYREHDHNVPERSYGIVKHAAYNEKRKRIDLICALNATKEACDRNGGLIADEELEILYKSGSLPVSMACRVSYDICSGCGNKAKSRTEYCTSSKCTKYGGCSRNLGKTFDDGHTLHVINPDPIFFDISYVRVPADRIAYALGLLESDKFASINLDNIDSLTSFYKNVKKASIPTWLLEETGPSYYVSEQIKKLDKLVEMEKDLDKEVNQRLKYANANNFTDDLDIRVKDVKAFLKYSFIHECLLPPKLFSNIIYGSHNAIDFDATNTFEFLRNQHDIDYLLENNKYKMATNESSYDLNLIRKYEPYLSLNEKMITKRASLSQIRGNYRTKKSSYINEEYLKNYGLYQLAFLEYFDYNNDICRKVIKMNKYWNM